VGAGEGGGGACLAGTTPCRTQEPRTQDPAPRNPAPRTQEPTSAKMQPMDQVSMAGLYLAKKLPHSSGARYQRVAT